MSVETKDWARTSPEAVEPGATSRRDEGRARKVTQEIEVPGAVAAGINASLLVVDAYRPIADALKDLLGARGWQVERAYDGRGALRLVELLRPDVILCDLGLRDRPDAFDMARLLRASPIHWPVYLVATTTRELSECREQALAAGFDAVLQKPLEVDTIDGLISERQPRR